MQGSAGGRPPWTVEEDKRRSTARIASFLLLAPGMLSITLGLLLAGSLTAAGKCVALGVLYVVWLALAIASHR